VAKIRVLVVDDAVVVRRMLTELLSADPAFEVVGAAPNGKIALDRLPQWNPDAVVLDVEMPELDGLSTLREIRKTYPKLPVVMFSALTAAGAKATFDALEAGATTYFTKPSAADGPGAVQRVVREELIPSLKTICGALPATSPVARIAVPKRIRSAVPIEVVVLASSTGGPNALADVFAELPREFPVPLLIVQHMPPVFTAMLAERLSSRSGVAVEEARPRGTLRPAHAWIAPGDHHLVVRRDGAQTIVDVVKDPPENSVRPAADVLFRSVAKSFGPSVLAVVLTGMGRDGLRGAEAVKEAGGQVIVQDEASSVVWGMPGHVAKAGLADAVLPLRNISGEIVRRAAVGRPGGR
jgi:two-component system chemotaxis response regulator CheB